MAQYYVIRDKNTGLYFRGKGVNRWGKYYNQASIYRVRGMAENTIKEVAWRGEEAEIVPIQITESVYGIGSLTFFCHDLGETISIHDYLKKLLTTLWVEQDEFSGKRPFGNSGWMYDIMACLISHKIIPGVLDDEGFVMDGDDNECLTIIQEYIKTM